MHTSVCPLAHPQHVGAGWRLPGDALHHHRAPDGAHGHLLHQERDGTHPRRVWQDGKPQTQTDTPGTSAVRMLTLVLPGNDEHTVLIQNMHHKY